MKYLRKFATEADIADVVQPNVILVAESKKVLYNHIPYGVYIQHIDGRLYTNDEWSTNGFANEEANGVAVIADECSFVIAKEDLPNMAWSSSSNTLIEGVTTEEWWDVAQKDYAGEINTSEILKTDTGKAVFSCVNFIFPNGQNGYLAAAGEWLIAYNNKSKIEAALIAIGGSVPSTSNNGYWTSTQQTKSFAYVFYWQNKTTIGRGKDTAYGVRAFAHLNI